MGKQAIRLNQKIIDEYTKTLRHGFNNKKEVGKSLEINKDLQRQQLNQITKNYSYSSGEKEKLRDLYEKRDKLTIWPLTLIVPIFENKEEE